MNGCLYCFFFSRELYWQLDTNYRCTGLQHDTFFLEVFHCTVSEVPLQEQWPKQLYCQAFRGWGKVKFAAVALERAGGWTSTTGLSGNKKRCECVSIMVINFKVFWRTRLQMR